MTTEQTGEPTVADQASILLQHVAGYASHRTVGIGLRAGLIRELAQHPEGLRPEQLAGALSFDTAYVAVWCRSAFAAGVCSHENGRYKLSAHMATLLLEEDSPAYAGGVFLVFEQPEMFDRFERVLPSGERLWWDECSPEWISSVSGTGTPFYSRLIPNGLNQVPALAPLLEEGVHVIDTACGAGVGVVRLAQIYPKCTIHGVDGDAHSIELARERAHVSGLSDRVTFQVSPLEEMSVSKQAQLIINNISMHECRDIDEVTRRVQDALAPGGWFVISDFPFPDSFNGLASVPGRIMGGIQFFEAQIGDQLLPRSDYDALLSRHGFSELGTVQLSPVHALTWGRKS